jgi:hypothetical protein
MNIYRLLSLFTSESSIPTLTSIMKRDEDNLNHFRTLKSTQIPIEEQAVQRSHQIADKPMVGCQPPA